MWQRFLLIFITKRLVHTCDRKRKETEIKCKLERESEEERKGESEAGGLRSEKSIERGRK